MNKLIRIAVITMLVLSTALSYEASAQNRRQPRRDQSYSQNKKEFREGHVWLLTMIQTKPGAGEDYIKSLKSTLRRMDEEAVRQGVMVSYKMLSGMSANSSDWDILLMEEYRDMASLDGIDDRMKPIREKFVGDDEATRGLMQARTGQRTIFGDKLMREIVFD